MQGLEVAIEVRSNSSNKWYGWVARDRVSLDKVAIRQFREPYYLGRQLFHGIFAPGTGPAALRASRRAQWVQIERRSILWSGPGTWVAAHAALSRWCKDDPRDHFTSQKLNAT